VPSIASRRRCAPVKAEAGSGGGGGLSSSISLIAGVSMDGRVAKGSRLEVEEEAEAAAGGRREGALEVFRGRSWGLREDLPVRGGRIRLTPRRRSIFLVGQRDDRPGRTVVVVEGERALTRLEGSTTMESPSWQRGRLRLHSTIAGGPKICSWLGRRGDGSGCTRRRKKGRASEALEAVSRNLSLISP
jgi:hypothetical protein